MCRARARFCDGSADRVGIAGFGRLVALTVSLAHQLPAPPPPPLTLALALRSLHSAALSHTCFWVVCRLLALDLWSCLLAFLEVRGAGRSPGRRRALSMIGENTPRAAAPSPTLARPARLRTTGAPPGTGREACEDGVARRAREGTRVEAARESGVEVGRASGRVRRTLWRWVPKKGEWVSGRSSSGGEARRGFQLKREHNRPPQCCRPQASLRSPCSVRRRPALSVPSLQSCTLPLARTPRVRFRATSTARPPCSPLAVVLGASLAACSPARPRPPPLSPPPSPPRPSPVASLAVHGLVHGDVERDATTRGESSFSSS